MSRPRTLSLILTSVLLVAGCGQGGDPSEERDEPSAGAPSPQGSYTFVKTQDGGSERPVAWDPCRPIEYYVHDALEPRAADGLVSEALAEVSAVSGLEFRYLGSTDRRPWTEEQELQPVHEPVVIGWDTPRGFGALAGRTAGAAWSRWDRDEAAQELHYVSGQLVLDAPHLRRVLREPDGRAQARAVVLHELGHLVGLLHVADPGELMHPKYTGRLGWGPGDREGLEALGSGSCFG